MAGEIVYHGPEFKLISRDALGVAQPLPTKLGPLPLYLIGNGYYSVLGPSLSRVILEDYHNGSPNDALTYNNTGIDLAPILAPSQDKFFCQSPKCSGNSGPHTCSARSYTCKVPGCTRPTPFKTQQALNRHYEVIHLAKRINCQFPGCENVGEKGIKRYDNFIVHMRHKHGVSPAGEASGE